MIVVVLYCYAINDWESRLRRQIERLHSSGLYEKADELHFFTADPNADKEELIKGVLKDSPKINFNYTVENHYEFLALRKVDELAKKQDCKILYFHTKGVWNTFKNLITQEIDTLKVSSIHTWVDTLEYYLIDNWEKCVEKLDSFDTVGVTNYGNWWWGNFWWAKSSHIENNTPFINFAGARWTAEAWLHAANKDPDHIKYYEFFHFNFDPHYSTIPKYFYDGTDISSIEYTINEAKYGYFATQRDEGQGLPDENESTVDVTEKIKELLAENHSNKVLHFNLSDINAEDPAPGWPKALRVNYSTNIDPENKYVLSSCFATLSIK